MSISIVPKGFQSTSHKIFSSYVPPKFAKENQSFKSNELGYCDCSVCLCPIEEPTTLVQCQHIFCFDCIRFWFKKDNRCPLCKQKSTSFIRTKLTGAKELWRNPKMTLKRKNESATTSVGGIDIGDVVMPTINLHEKKKSKRRRSK